MIEIGEQPIIWHIMKGYSHYGFNDFIICCGYKGHIIKEYFANYYLHRSDMTFDLSNHNEITIHNNHSEPFRITVVDTGLNTMTGGRLKRIQKYISEENFMLTYGDGVSDIDLNQLIDGHNKSGKIVTLTAVQPGGRFGMLDIHHDGTIHNFAEKKQEDGGWINGGFMVMKRDIFDYLEGDETILEHEPLETLASKGQLNSYLHNGFWKCMDTLRDKEYLEKFWAKGNAPWKLW